MPRLLFAERLATNLEGMAAERDQSYSNAPLLLNAAAELRRLSVVLGKAEEDARVFKAAWLAEDERDV